MQKNRARALALTGLFSVALLTGCTLTASDVGPMTQVTPFEQAEALSQPAYGAPYVIATGDQITVRFYYNPQLDEDVTVRPDGNISLSLVGDMPANGKTPDQLSKEITDKYADYLTKPVAVVLIRVSALARVFVSGEIAKPGVVSLNNGFDTVLPIHRLLGRHLRRRNLGHVILIRHVPSQAEPIVVQLDLARAIGGEDSATGYATAAERFRVRAAFGRGLARRRDAALHLRPAQPVDGRHRRHDPALAGPAVNRRAGPARATGRSACAGMVAGS